MTKNKSLKFTALALASLGLLFADEDKAEEKVEQKVVQGHVFAWPFAEIEKMQPRGGTTKGAEVTLDTEPSAAWKSLQKKAEKPEQDRRAILAMAGDYRVSFDFMETLGFSEDYQPPAPYFSWGTEHVEVIANEPKFVSLQHTLVMYFKDKDGKEIGPMVMKHWRQDWRYEDTDLHVYVGNQTWKRREQKATPGFWTQAVYQVDDSPRYEVVGRWSHLGGMSVWKSNNCWRPLPRREFSVRDDYNVLAGTHQITITPTGWVHVQQNQKLNLEPRGKKTFVGQELGVNRYERISSPSLAAASETWGKTAPYWAEVRAMWAEIYDKDERFSLKAKVDDKKLYQHHFGYAAEVEEKGYDPEAGRKHARETILKFLGKTAESGKY
ncbi:hypothetical protein N9F61_00430 [Akkermansiaceae bacterium]|nr:hypothetical protein [Akkermansiaceae bacterium]MDB4143171.1 hypothetical protein [Akkermansiaceae bacterium]MDB4569579.1 hypothetical protein [Akkermansiaceae bacterium]